MTLATAGSASAADDPLLATADSFSVLAYSTVTNTGPSIINENLGLTPGPSVVGFPPGTVNGTIHIANGVAAQAQVDTQAAYTNAANQTLGRLTIPVELASSTLVAGLYESTGAGVLQNSGTLTFDGQGVTTGIWVFQSTSTLITAAGSQMVFTNGANPCNVFWQVASSATLGSASTFGGTILASDSIQAQTGATITGRLLALNGAVSLDSNVISTAGCAISTLPPVVTAPAPAVGPAATLPNTGSTAPQSLIAAGALLALGGLGIIAVRARRTRTDGRIEAGRS